jgi:hypothetical protein
VFFLRELSEIIKIIETKAIEQYGSINKMLTVNKINRSIIGNMKRNPPSIPNIIDFCKLAEALSLQIGFLLNEEAPSSYLINANDIIKDRLAADERNIIDAYRELDEDGKDLVQRSIREIWADHRQPKCKSTTTENKNIG